MSVDNIEILQETILSHWSLPDVKQIALQLCTELIKANLDKTVLESRLADVERENKGLKAELAMPGCPNPECHWFTPCLTCKTNADFCDYLIDDNFDGFEPCPHWQWRGAQPERKEHGEVD